MNIWSCRRIGSKAKLRVGSKDCWWENSSGRHARGISYKYSAGNVGNNRKSLIKVQVTRESWTRALGKYIPLRSREQMSWQVEGKITQVFRTSFFPMEWWRDVCNNRTLQLQVVDTQLECIWGLPFFPLQCLN